MELNHAPRLPKDAPIAKGPMKAVLQNNLRLMEHQGDLETLRATLNALAASRSPPSER